MPPPRNEIHGGEWLLLALIVLAMGLAAHTARAVEERAKGKPTTMSPAKVPCARAR